MLGWWGKTFDATVPRSTTTFGPNMPLPSSNVHRTWPRLLEAIKFKSTENTNHTTNASIIHVPGPIWVPIQNNDHHKESLPDATDAVEFISISELNTLREQNNNRRSRTIKIDDVSAPNPNLSIPSTKKQKINSDVFHKIQQHDPIEEEAVEYVSMAVLQQLRKNNNVQLSDQHVKPTPKCAQGGYVFVGKWFLKSLSEIRDDVLQGGNIRLIE